MFDKTYLLVEVPVNTNVDIVHYTQNFLTIFSKEAQPVLLNTIDLPYGWWELLDRADEATNIIIRSQGMRPETTVMCIKRKP